MISAPQNGNRNVRRIAVVVSHPIQYQAPWFRELAAHDGIELEVLFCHNATADEQSGAGFGVPFNWDSNLLEGYRYRFLTNVAAKPSIHSFGGLDTPEIYDVVANGRYDAVIVNGWNFRSAWQTMRACWKTKTPIMVRSDSHLRTQRPGLKRLVKWPFYNWFIPKFDACLPVGQWSLEYFLHYGAKSERIFTIPHIIDDRFFSQEAQRLRPSRNVLRDSWNLPPEATVFLFVGKFLENKRPFDFIEAIAQASRRGARVAGLMVGDGPLRRASEEYVLNSHSPVSFTGFLNQSEIPKAYVAADALIIPSSGETWGLVTNEAMACGLPCFVSNHVGCGPDLIMSNETGEVFPVGDIKKLSQLIQEFASDDTRRMAMGASALNRAKLRSASTAVEATLAALTFVGSKKKR